MGDDGMFIDPPIIDCGRKVLWPRGAISDDRNLKIFSVFSGVKLFPFKRVIFQFWRPRTDGGSLVLECFRSPYALLRLNRPLHRIYRPLSMKYEYSIDNTNPNPSSKPPWIISNGPMATAFMNHFPEVILDLRAHQGSNPLLDCGLECDLTCCVMLPIFDRECIIGVVECSMKNPRLLLPIFNELKRELEREGLSMYHVQGSWPYKAIAGDWELAKNELEKGLMIACESHNLTLGQVWIPYDSENDHQMRLVKLTRYFVDVADSLYSIKDFYDTFDVVNTKMGEGLIGRTLETHRSHLCRNLYKLSNTKGILGILSANTKCTCLVICLRSTHTGELDYAFEFFWPRSRNHLILLDNLSLTLMKYLPSFKFASGEQLGDELITVDVENSSLEALNEASTSAGTKRKFISDYPLTNINNRDDNEDDDDHDDEVAIYASYRHRGSLFYLPSSSTFINVMEKLKKEFDELDLARTYKVEYEVFPGKWSSLVCLESCRRREDMSVVKVRVRADGRHTSWQWQTNV